MKARRSASSIASWLEPKNRTDTRPFVAMIKLTMKPHLLRAAFAGGLLLLAGCDYDVPITAGPTRPIDPRLLGEWISHDPDDKKDEAMNVRKLDEFNYVVAIDGDIYRVFHTDHANLPFVSAQDLNSSSRKYVYYTWKLSADVAQLTLKRVTQDVIPDSAKDSGAIQQLLTEHAADPKLLGKELVFTRRPTK